MRSPSEIIMEMLLAEEALSSCEIEGIRLPPRERFITKCLMVWPDLDRNELGLVYDHMEKPPTTLGGGEG